MKTQTAGRNRAERWRVITVFLTCLGLVASSACSTSPSTGQTTAGATAAPGSKAGQLQTFIRRGTEVEITDRDGRVRKVRVTRIDNETITGKTKEGKVQIPITDVYMARVQTGSSKPKRKQWDLNDGEWTAVEVGGVIILGAAAVAGGAHVFGSGVADGLAAWAGSMGP